MNRTEHLLHLVKIFFSYLKRIETADYMPSRLWIETTSRCNLKCDLCINKDMPDSQKSDMDLKLYKKIRAGISHDSSATLGRNAQTSAFRFASRSRHLIGAN